MVAPAVADVIVTLWDWAYVPAGTLNVGAATALAIVNVPDDTVLSSIPAL
jgi:hypothetical protein